MHARNYAQQGCKMQYWGMTLMSASQAYVYEEFAGVGGHLLTQSAAKTGFQFQSYRLN